jgi:hypothetical protein
LQPRDEALIAAVYEYRFLSRAQIQRLLGFGCVTRVNARLRKLFDHRYLSRRFLPAVKGSAEALYCLGPESVPIVGEKLGLDSQEIKRKRKDALEVKDLFLRHNLLVNDVRIATVLASQDDSRFQFGRWIDQSDLRLKVNERTAAGEYFSPDGYCQYRYEDKLYAFFLELDRSTMSNQRFVGKVYNFLEFGLSGSYRSRFAMNFFRVLVVTQTLERLLNLKTTVESVTDKMFWFASIDDHLPLRVFDRIWHRAGQTGLWSLSVLEAFDYRWREEESGGTMKLKVTTTTSNARVLLGRTQYG